MERCSGYKIYNLGGHDRTTLRELVAAIEAAFAELGHVDAVGEAAPMVPLAPVPRPRPRCLTPLVLRDPLF